jgi:hypothetical protein
MGELPNRHLGVTNVEDAESFVAAEGEFCPGGKSKFRQPAVRTPTRQVECKGRALRWERNVAHPYESKGALRAAGAISGQAALHLNLRQTLAV